MLLGVAALVGASVLGCRASAPTERQPEAEPLAPLAPLDATRLEALRGELERRIEDSEDDEGWRVAGAVALIERDSRLEWSQRLGTPLVRGIRVEPVGAAARKQPHDRIVFPIHSMTKPIVSVAVLQLVEEGRLALDDPIERYLPEFADAEVVVLDESGVLVGTRSALRSITIADLLGHTSGLGYAMFADGALKTLYEEAELGREFTSNRELSRAIAALPLAFEPGSQWRYGRSTDVLGALLEELEGASLQSILTYRVFVPLGMEDTAFCVPSNRRDRRASDGLSPISSTLGSNQSVTIRLPGSLLDPVEEPAACNAGGGLYSTASDYLAFCQMLLGGGQWNGVRVLSEESVRLLTTDRIAGLPRQGFLGDRGFGLGVAVLTEDSAGPLNGSVGSFHWSGIAGTSFFVDPEERLIGVFMIDAFRDFSFMVAFRKGVYAALPGYASEPSMPESPAEEPADSPSPLSVGGSDVGE